MVNGVKCSSPNLRVVLHSAPTPSAIMFEPACCRRNKAPEVAEIRIRNFPRQTFELPT